LTGRGPRVSSVAGFTKAAWEKIHQQSFAPQQKCTPTCDYFCSMAGTFTKFYETEDWLKKTVSLLSALCKSCEFCGKCAGTVGIVYATYTPSIEELF
jgi:hypothetical protein